jgi:hypothetical protein
MTTAQDNTPGRPSVSRRVGTSGEFAARMTAEISRQPALQALTTRRTDDPAIALVDAWSAVLDVLSFYSDRVANEAYLRTVLDPRSLIELALTVGYVPGRGRASAAWLAFTLEDAPGAPTEVPIPAGTKVASLPAPGEVPQNYETTEDVEARPAWNAVRAVTRVPRVPGVAALGAYVEGSRTDLAVGDAVLVVGREREADGLSSVWAFRRLAVVRPVPDLAATWIGWVDPLVAPVPDPRDLRLHVLRRKAAIFGAAAPDFRLINDTAGGGRTTRKVELADRADDRLKERIQQQGPDWPGFSVRVPSQPESTVDLDTTYPQAVTGSWAVLTRTGVTACYEVTAAVEESRTEFTLNGKVTRLTLRGRPVSTLFGASVRQTSAWVGSELLPLAAAPVVLPVQGDEVRLARSVPTLGAGSTVVVRGPRPRVQVDERVRGLRLRAAGRASADLHPGDVLEVVGPVTENADGSTTWTTTRGQVTAPAGSLVRVTPADDATVSSETAVVAGPTPDAPEIEVLRFTAALTGCYDPEAVRILANVASATHGETRDQVLGSGDASAAYQQFRLAQAPLTYVSTSEGTVRSTLEVRVDGRLWTEVPRLFGTGPGDEVFTTHQDDEGTVTVLFGDGRTGARLPTGSNNVTATYRVGTGIAGRVTADQLTLPMTRPLGLRSVTNPLASGLAADPESPTEVRANAPRTALALERVVSLRDVEDFARAVPGIGKAGATWLWNGRHRFVHLTVAGSGGQAIDAQEVQDLRAALLAAGDARLPLQVDVAEVVPVHVSVSVVVDPVHEAPVVLDGVGHSITAALSVDARTLGQPLTGGDIILAAHAVPGVVAVNVTLPTTDVRSSQAHVVGGEARPAQLVVLAPGGLTVTEASS